MCILASLEDPASDECVIPIFNELADAEFAKHCFEGTVQQTRNQFVTTPELAKQACH